MTQFCLQVAFLETILTGLEKGPNYKILKMKKKNEKRVYFGSNDRFS